MKRYILKLFHRKVPKYIDSEYHDILNAYSTYYQMLDPVIKEKFRLRLYRLLNVLSFGSMKIPDITREMRVVIGSAIIKITLGLDNYIPTRFTNVVVLPRRYMYPGFGEPFLGHTDHNTNTIFFSWEDVQHGYLVPDDAVNVALHEMAHVLEAENGFYEIFTNFFDRFDWVQWAELAAEKMDIIRNGQNEFLKSYGGQNMMEMFAVCVEAFFEQPIAFKSYLPDIYNTMVELLKQDPAYMIEAYQKK